MTWKLWKFFHGFRDRPCYPTAHRVTDLAGYESINDALRAIRAEWLWW